MANGNNLKLVGRNVSDLMDMDRKEYVKDRLEMAKERNSLWQVYKSTNPATKQIVPKRVDY